MRALVWPVATHGCEAWTLRKQEERRIQAFENKCIRKLLRIPWTKLMTTAQVYKMAGTENELLNHIKSLKLWYFGHMIRQPHDNVESSVMVGLVEGVGNRGRQRMCWLDNICQWTGLSGDSGLYAVRDKRYWTSQTHPCSQPLWSDDGEMAICYPLSAFNWLQNEWPRRTLGVYYMSNSVYMTAVSDSAGSNFKNNCRKSNKHRPKLSAAEM